MCWKNWLSLNVLPVYYVLHPFVFYKTEQELFLCPEVLCQVPVMLSKASPFCCTLFMACTLYTLQMIVLPTLGCSTHPGFSCILKWTFHVCFIQFSCVLYVFPRGVLPASCILDAFCMQCRSSEQTSFYFLNKWLWNLGPIHIHIFIFHHPLHTPSFLLLFLFTFLFLYFSVIISFTFISIYVF